jgi:peptidoglycan/LPS O-acetylase OafA/YrhL
METSRNAARDLPLDFVKGILVVVMVVYHVMNYFSNAGPYEFGYVRFVTGSFIFISGYIISTFYRTRFQKDRTSAARRLYLRGLKLFAVFTSLNLLMTLTGIRNPTKAPLDLHSYLNNLNAIYVLGSPRIAAFQILLSISYLLMISPVVLLFSRFRKSAAIITLAIAFCLSFLDTDSVNIGLGIVGLVGLSVGLLMGGLEDSFSIKQRSIIFAGLVIVIFLIDYLSRNVMTYSLGIMVMLKLFYDLGKSINLRHQVSQAIVLLGQYSLVCYIAQIVFLQAVARMFLQERWGLGWEMVSIVLVTSLFLAALCLLMRIIRERHVVMDKAYKLVFS